MLEIRTSKGVSYTLLYKGFCFKLSVNLVLQYITYLHEISSERNVMFIQTIARYMFTCHTTDR